MIVRLLIQYHTIASGRQYRTLGEVREILENPQLLHTLHLLTPTANGVIVPDLVQRRFAPHYLVNDPSCPILSYKGIQYPKRELGIHASRLKELDPNHIPRNLKEMPQARCPAVYTYGELQLIKPGFLPKPGASTEAYFDHLEHLASLNPELLTVARSGDTLTFKAAKTPITLFNAIHIGLLERFMQVEREGN